ncbi:MAG: PilZ domain-containing protein [Inhella sp.]
MTSPRDTDRRHHARVHFDGQAQLITTDGRATVQLVDVSLKGALVRLPANAEVAAGEPCLLSLQLGDVHIKMAAEIAHLAGREAGLRCAAIDLDSISHLRRLVAMNLGDPQLAERELRALLAA